MIVLHTCLHSVRRFYSLYNTSLLIPPTHPSQHFCSRLAPFQIYFCCKETFLQNTFSLVSHRRASFWICRGRLSILLCLEMSELTSKVLSQTGMSIIFNYSHLIILIKLKKKVLKYFFSEKCRLCIWIKNCHRVTACLKKTFADLLDCIRICFLILLGAQ